MALANQQSNAKDHLASAACQRSSPNTLATPAHTSRAITKSAPVRLARNHAAVTRRLERDTRLGSLMAAPLYVVANRDGCASIVNPEHCRPKGCASIYSAMLLAAAEAAEAAETGDLDASAWPPSKPMTMLFCTLASQFWALLVKTYCTASLA